MASSLRTASSFVLSTLLLASLFIQPATAHGGDDDMDEDRPNLKARGLVLVKIYCLVIIFFATFIPGVSPYYLRWNNTFLVLGIQYAGGVFLGTAMLHFLGDSNSTFMDLTPKEYPFAFMLAVSGYLMTMLADVIIQAVYARQPVANRTPPTDLETNATDGKLQSERDVKSCCGQAPADCSRLNDEAPEVQNIVKATLIKQASWGDAVLLIFALCFHSVFEGIAIGVADTKADAWRNLWTVSLHKSFAAISMGIALLRMLPDRPLLSCATYAFAFAISSPIGVAIGLAIDATTQGPTADWIYAIAMGLAAGIFIFVAINHLLAKGFTPPCKIKADRPLFKFFAVTLGAGTIFVAMIWD